MQAAVNLTPRETEVLETMLTGISTNKALAHHLKISSATVVCHIHEASRKFGKTNRLETLLAYMKHKEGKKMERTFETASAPVMFICDTYQLPHRPVYSLADRFLRLYRMHDGAVIEDSDSTGYTMAEAVNEITKSLMDNGITTPPGEIIHMVETAVARRFA